MFLLCFTKILNQAFYMTHTFDSEVSLHSWSTVRHTTMRAQRGKTRETARQDATAQSRWNRGAGPHHGPDWRIL